jgi:hypothetical protein
VPLTLTPAPLVGLRAVLSRDGRRVAWVGQDDAGRWAAFESALDQARQPDPRITAWRDERLHVTDYFASANALVGADPTGNVLRYPLPGGHETAPVTLDTVPAIVNFSGPWPRLSADGRYVLYDANTAAGWLSRVVPLAGGAPVERPGAWYRDLVTSWGLVHHEPVRLSAAFARGGGPEAAAPRPLTGWHRSEMRGAWLDAGGRWLVYAVDWPAPGWYAVPVDGRREAPPEAPCLPVETWGAPWPEGPPQPRPAVVGGSLVRQRGDVVEAVRLDRCGAEAPQALLEGVRGQALFDESGERVIAVHSGRILALEPARGAAGEPVVVAAAESVQAMVLHPDGQRLLVLDGEPWAGEARLLLVRLDGSDADAPRVLVDPVVGWALGLAFSPTGEHVLSAHSVEATAVPHPDRLMTTSTGPGAVTSRDLAPRGTFFWGVSEWFGFPDGGGLRLDGLVATADGRHVLLRGFEGLHSAGVDGSDASAPVFLGVAATVVGPPLQPGGGALVLSTTQDHRGVFAAEAGRADSQRSLAALEGELVVQARWSLDGRHVVLRTQRADVFRPEGALYQLSLASDVAEGVEGVEGVEALTPDDLPVSALLGLVPDGRGALFESAVLGDRALFWVGVGDARGSGPDGVLLVTPSDDAEERLVGMVPQAD